MTAACARWAFRRSRHTASSRSSGSDSLIVTHPFHPLAGQRVAILFERTYRHLPLGRVYICDGGTLGNVTLPDSFTDRGVPAAVQPLTADVLTDLAAVVAVLRPHLTDHNRGSSLV
jgi:hypothetical protein